MSETGQLRLSIYSPERRLLHQALVEELTLPSSEGQIQVLPGHAAMIGTLETGAFSYKPAAGGPEAMGAISTGFFEVKDEDVTVLAETLELSNEIDVQRAKNAQSKAEQELHSPELTEASFRKYQLKLQRALIRQQVAGRNAGL